MKQEPQQPQLRMIAIDCIEVLNPRDRNSRVFDEIVGNIDAVGLKRPITVTPRRRNDGSERYKLICGEGRLKAYKALGETTIPAMIIDVSDEDGFIMSLAENIARRQSQPLELLAGIEHLRERGYEKSEIAEKTGLSPDYVSGILQLFKIGEERLLIAVESGRIPLNIGLTIARSRDDKDVQSALQDAYESGQLRGRQLQEARQVIQRRQSLGRLIKTGRLDRSSNVTSSSLVRSYQQEVERQKLIIKKAEFSQQKLIFITEALRQLLEDENFSYLLRAEGLETLPKYLADRVWAGGQPA
jgi:ParB family chromosome partitioning protein